MVLKDLKLIYIYENKFIINNTYGFQKIRSLITEKTQIIIKKYTSSVV